MNRIPRRRAGRGGWLWAVVLGWLLAGTARAQTPEEAMFSAAARAFQDGIYERAEQEFAVFVQNFPESPQAGEAILLQGQAALKQGKLKSAVDLLTANLSKAGARADQFLYWTAEGQFQSGNFPAAAGTFARIIREFPKSARLLEASHGEALARFKLKEWRRTVEILRQPDGTFQQSARARANDELAARGHLLLGEALLELRDYKAGEEALRRMPETELIPEYKWRRLYLLCRMGMADQRLEEALGQTTNLLALAGATGQRLLQAESVSMQGGILAALGRLDAAAQVFTNNLADAVPPENRRQALLKIIELTLAQEKISEAMAKLETFFARHPEDAASDAALLTLGELHLKQHALGVETNRAEAVPPPAGTNHLQQALEQFDKFVGAFTNSALLGKAHLGRGWCLWAGGKFAESLPSFQAAADLLPLGEDLAVARFKLADAQFLQRDFTNALAHYRSVVDDFGAWPRVKNALLDHALYQMLRAALELNDLPPASAAMLKILKDSPASVFADRSLLLVGQNLSLAGRPVEARLVFTTFASRFPTNALRPEVELAIARSYVQEKKWPAAIQQYEDWLERFATNAQRPRAEFNRAWVHYQAGLESNALALFTNFTAQFPTDELAPRAQNWVADYFFRQGDFVNADKNYQILFQSTNWPVSTLTYQARLMAGRAAFARQVYKDADKYFADLINVLLNDTNSPPDLLAEAWLRLGDTVTEGSRLDAAKPRDSRFSEAIIAFNKITQQFPTNRYAPQAWGRVGDCHLQLAEQDAKRYDQAIDAYQKVIDMPQADATDRSRAEVGMALALERSAPAKAAAENAAALKSAFDHYYNIVCGKNLRTDEKPDPYWIKEAGFAAARLAEDRKEWEIAVKIYERLQGLLPPLRPLLDKKVEKAREQLHLETP